MKLYAQPLEHEPKHFHTEKKAIYTVCKLYLLHRGRLHEEVITSSALEMSHQFSELLMLIVTINTSKYTQQLKQT